MSADTTPCLQRRLITFSKKPQAIETSVESSKRYFLRCLKKATKHFQETCYFIKSVASVLDDVYTYIFTLCELAYLRCEIVICS